MLCIWDSVTGCVCVVYLGQCDGVCVCCVFGTVCDGVCYVVYLGQCVTVCVVYL